MISLKTEQNGGLPGAGWYGEALFSRCKVSVLPMQGALERDGGDGCPTR